MTEQDYVTFDVAEELRKNGYNHLTQYSFLRENYNDKYKKGMRMNTMTAHRDLMCPLSILTMQPSLWDAKKWIREKYNLHIEVGVSSDYSTDADGNKCDEWSFWVFNIYYITNIQNHLADCYGAYDTYEEALNEGIKKALEFV